MYTEILSKLIITEINLVTTIYSKKNAKANRMNRMRWAIIIKYEGETIYHSKGKTYCSNINNMVILPKGCSYEWTCTKSGHYSVIEFESDLSYDEIIYFENVDGEKFLKYFKNLENKRTDKNDFIGIESIKDTYLLILKLAKEIKPKYVPGEKYNKIAPAIGYITKNYNKKIKNDELAVLTGFSTIYFRKLFAEVMGSGPLEYIHRFRIKKAKEMLKSDYGSITDIAYSLGYLNVYDFSRDFKKYTGIPPSRY